MFCDCELHVIRLNLSSDKVGFSDAELRYPDVWTVAGDALLGGCLGGEVAG